jgi:cell division protein FtsB
MMSQRKSRVSHAKEIYYALCVAVFVVSALFSIWGPGGYMEMRKAQRDLEVHRSKVSSLRRANAERMQAIQALRSDKDALESYARKQGYARKDEIIQQLPEEPPPPPPVTPTKK